MNDVKIASDLARMSIGVMDTTAQIMQLLRALTLFYVEKMKDDRDRQLLLDFYGAGEKEIKLLREQNKKDGKNNPLTIKSYDINPSNLKILQSICKRDGIAYMINQISTTDLVPDGIGDSVQTGKFTMSVYSTRQQEFEAAIREAKIRSGQELEMDASYLIGPSNLREKDVLQRKGVIFIDTQLASENPIKWMKEPIPEDKYVLMRQTIQKLPPEMRSTLIYRKLEDGTRQVGFLSKTEQLFDKKGKINKEIKALAPLGNKRMAKNPITNGSIKAQDMVELGKYCSDIILNNKDNFRIFGPDETKSNRLYEVFKVTNRQ